MHCAHTSHDIGPWEGPWEEEEEIEEEEEEVEEVEVVNVYRCTVSKESGPHHHAVPDPALDVVAQVEFESNT